MKNIRTILGAAIGLALSANSMRHAPEAAPLWSAPRGKAKPKQGRSNPLRGYYNRYSHRLTEYVTEQNLKRMAQRSSGQMARQLKAMA